MAFFKTAAAKIVRPDVQLRQWRRQHRTASATPSATSIVEQATRILEEPFDPKNYLLTHATIVCSVDVEHVPGAKTGRDYVSGEPIKRLFTDFYITKETEHLVNDNGDAWSRGVILKSYGTFRGAQNYLEHVQDPAQSKGRIIDAVIRDTGTSLYVDILVATHRKHTALIADILSGKMATMSMGCSATHTTCTKCGNVAYDDSDTCPCIRYSKGSKFLDGNGQVRVVAELCGHVSVDPNGGVEFIEGSFVENPAFKGAVLRNIVDNLTPDQIRSAQDVFSRQASTDLPWDLEGIQKAASKRTVAYDFDDEGEGEEPAEAPAEPPKEKDRLKDVEDEAYEAITRRLTQRIMKDLDKADGPRPDSDGSNNNLQNYASVIRLAHSSSNEAEVIDRAAAFFYSQGVYIPPHICRKALTLGALDLKHPGSKRRWIAAYRKADLDPKYKGVMVVLGRLLSQRPHIKTNN